MEAIVTWEGKHRIFTAEEERAEAELRAARSAVADAVEAITDHELASKLDIITGEVELAIAYLIHARLCRMLPHLTDVIALGCFPWGMETPENLGPGGMPEPAMEPVSALESHYHSAYENAQRNREWAARQQREAASADT